MLTRTKFVARGHRGADINTVVAIEGKHEQIICFDQAVTRRSSSWPARASPARQFSKLDNASVTKILYANIMDTEPDTSPRNVRVAPTKGGDAGIEKVGKEGGGQRGCFFFPRPLPQELADHFSVWPFRKAFFSTIRAAFVGFQLSMYPGGHSSVRVCLPTTRYQLCHSRTLCISELLPPIQGRGLPTCRVFWMRRYDIRFLFLKVSFWGICRCCVPRVHVLCTSASLQPRSAG